MDGNATEDVSLTLQYLRGRVNSLEGDKKKLEEKLKGYQHIESQLKSIWNIIFPTEAAQAGGDVTAQEKFNVDKLHEEYNKITTRISDLENNVFCLKNRESELLLRLSAAQKRIHKHQTQIVLLRDELKNHALRSEKSQFTDPIINYNFELMLQNINDLHRKLKSARDETLANGFNLQSQTGRSLIEKCKKLIIENQILGRQIQMNKHSNLTQKLILLHQHNLKLSEHIVKLNMMNAGGVGMGVGVGQGQQVDVTMMQQNVNNVKQ